MSEYFNNLWQDYSILGSDTRIILRQGFFQCHKFNQLEFFSILFNLLKSRILPFIVKSAFHCIDRTLCPWLSGSPREAESLCFIVGAGCPKGANTSGSVSSMRGQRHSSALIKECERPAIYPGADQDLCMRVWGKATS